uniref:Dehydrogenase/reductase (SDR family) member 13b.1 n=1 Tax=Oncorhynchus kisutch TaxID=8019 RepID=A0A8C7D5E7_ONCKI
MATFLLVVCVVVGIAFIYHGVVVKGQRCKSKTVNVTGSNTGIGKMTALDLARRGARVILAWRSKQLRLRSNEVVLMHLDLGSLKSVRSFGETFLKTERRLDLLINNAGIYMPGTTEDGLGMMFGVNHIGHFPLTNLLLYHLNKCGQSRVVNVASVGHIFGTIDFNCLNSHKEVGVGDSFMDVFKTYCNSKLCNVLFNHELAKILHSTNYLFFFSGAINSELTRGINKVAMMLMKPFFMFFLKNSVAGSQSTLHCVLQEGLEPLSGCYFSNCTVRRAWSPSLDATSLNQIKSNFICHIHMVSRC